MNKFEASRTTRNKRLERGWCYERAAHVVPIPRVKTGTQYDCSTLPLLYISKMVAISNEGNPVVKCLCECGQFIDVSTRDLFFDLNCGCKGTGCTPAKLSRIWEMEQDADFTEWCRDNKQVTTLPLYLYYKATKERIKNE